MSLGLATGLSLHFFADPDSAWYPKVIWTLDLIGKDIFIGALKMIIAPLIFASIVTGVCSLPNARELGNVGFKTFLYYFSTTAIAVAIGVAAVLIIQPGKKAASQTIRTDREQVLQQYRVDFTQETGLDPLDAEAAMQYRMYIGSREGEDIEGTDFASRWDRIRVTKTRTSAEMFRDEILRPILSNPFTALAKSPPNSLGVIFFAMIVGLACVIIGEPAKPVGTFFGAANAVMMKITMWLMEVAPYGIGCIIASLVATLGVDALRALGWYCATVIIGIGAHVCVLLMLVSVLGKMSPLVFLRGIRDAWLIAFTTTSSAATLPITIVCTTDNLKVSEKVSRFTLPVGATMNMDGTALYEGVAVIFLIQLFGGLDDAPIVLTGMKTFIIFITAVFASIGAAAIPSAGLITMAIVASAVGLPLHYIFLIYAVDHVLDMFRTSTNVLGDAVGAVIVNRFEAKNL